jgi:DNA-binding response OmpR family regulator
MDARVIVVEDEPEVLGLLQDILEMDSFVVTGVPRPDLVWDAISAGQPDLFLLDVMLPGMSGVELAQQLQDNIPNCPPMIALSASRLMLGVAEKSALFVATVSKPFDIDTLLATVERVLQPADISR